MRNYLAKPKKTHKGTMSFKEAYLAAMIQSDFHHEEPTAEMIELLWERAFDIMKARCGENVSFEGLGDFQARGNKYIKMLRRAALEHDKELADDSAEDYS
jgi:hypothetical protein